MKKFFINARLVLAILSELSSQNPTVLLWILQVLRTQSLKTQAQKQEAQLAHECIDNTQSQPVYYPSEVLFLKVRQSQVVHVGSWGNHSHSCEENNLIYR